MLNTKGWACGRTPHDPERTGKANVKAAWRCVRQQRSAGDEIKTWPPIPEVRPRNRRDADNLFVDPALEAAVRRDLASTIRKMAGQSAISAVAQGDLDGNRLGDAIVVLTNRNDQGRETHLVMAYLGDGESYNLTDIQVTQVQEAPEDRTALRDHLVVDINEGLIKLSVCCDDDVRPVLLAFRDRELVFRQ